MALVFPDLSGPLLQQVDVSGSINEADISGLEALESKRCVASYQDGERTVFSRVFAGWIDKDIEPGNRILHLHLGFACDLFFQNHALPEVNSTREEILSILDRFSDKPVDITWGSRFVVPLADVPRSSIIRPFLDVDADAMDLRVRMTGGRFSIQPPPLQRLTWFLRSDVGDGKSIAVDIVAGQDDRLSDDVFERGIEMMSSAFEAIILAGMKIADWRQSIRKST